MIGLRTIYRAFLLASVLLFGCASGTPKLNVERLPSLSPIPSLTEIRMGPVKDEADAIRIALDAWIPIYGRQEIENEKPYVAKLKNGIWTVEGSLPEGMDGGVAIARIAQKDGKVLETGHGK